MLMGAIIPVKIKDIINEAIYYADFDKVLDFILEKATIQ